MGLLLVAGVVIVVAGRGPAPAPARAAAPIAPLWTPPPDPMAQMRAILDASG
jgi:hypothetical protein